jgi:type II restriction enzyme
VTYKDEVNQLAYQIPTSLVDFNARRVRSSPPTQASSEFITNREQGDWAERLILQAINNTTQDFVAVQYGRGDQYIAGEPGFEEFYTSYQEELDLIGKRPDLLIFRTEDYDYDWSFNISLLPQNILDNIVPKAVAGLEIRSSSFLIGQYDSERSEQLVVLRSQLFGIRDKIITNFAELLPDKLQQALRNANEENLAELTYRIPSRSKLGEHGNALADQLEKIRWLRDKIHKTRRYLSFTAKVEDLYVVHKWTQTYGVPHYYFQVFFDRVYGIPFDHILRVISVSENEGKRFGVERNVKNQFKNTIHMNVKEGVEIAYKVTMPQHRSALKRLPLGRLLFHVTFEGGEAYLNLGTLYSLLQLPYDQE